MSDTPPWEQLLAFIERRAKGPLLVHSDLLRASCFVPKSTSRDALLKSHCDLLTKVDARARVWKPVFTYSFTTSGVFDARHSPSELGPLNEYMRQHWSTERSLDPVFSFAGTGEFKSKKPIGEELVAFGGDTAFASLGEQRGGILFYGAPLASMTFIHRIEFLARGPLYRYDKTFPGKIVDKEGATQSVRFIYHVRPSDKHLDYDWPRLKNDLEREGLLERIAISKPEAGFYIDCAALSEYWLQRLGDDPLYLLDEDSRSWVEPKLEALGRRFQIQDFEDIA